MVLKVLHSIIEPKFAVFQINSGDYQLLRAALVALNDLSVRILARVILVFCVDVPATPLAIWLGLWTPQNNFKLIKFNI